MKKFISAMVALCLLAIGTVTASADSYNAMVNPIAFIEQTVTYADFTDSGGTTGAVTLTPTLPAGAIPIAWRAVVTAGFTGDTSATLLCGLSSDTDKFSESSGQNVFAAGTYADSALGQTEGCDSLSSAQSVYLLMTGASDFTSIVTAANGSMVFRLYYLRP